MKCIQETPPFAPKQNKLRAYFKILLLKFSHKTFKVNSKDKKNLNRLLSREETEKVTKELLQNGF